MSGPWGSVGASMAATPLPPAESPAVTPPPPPLPSSVPTAASMANPTPPDARGSGSRMHNFLTHTPGDSETSPPTSPPSSAAPYTDDEFTSLVLRRAANRLGVDYSPGRSRHLGMSATAATYHRSVSQPAVPPLSSTANVSAGGLGAASSSMQDRDRATLLAMSRTQQLPAPGPQTWSLYGACSPEDLGTMIHVRQRALGSEHRSLAPLYDAIGDRNDVDGNLHVARTHYETALQLMDASDPNRCAMLGKLGSIAMRMKDPSAATEFFERAARFAQTGSETTADAVDSSAPQRGVSPGTREAEEQRMRDSERAQRLQQLLAETSHGVETTAQRREIAELLLRRDSGLDGTTSVLPSTSEVEIQTDAVGAGHGAAAMAYKDDAEYALNRIPPAPTLSASDVARIRAPSARGTEDLRSLLSYVADSRRAAQGTPAEATTAAIDAVRKRMAVTSSMRSAASHPAAGPRPDSVRDADAAADRLRQSATKLNETTSRVRSLALSVPRSRHVDETGEPLSPEQHTEREVARMLLESSIAMS